MPYRDRTRVERWINEYRNGHGADSPALDVSVLDKNFEAGPNSGIAVVALRSASTLTLLHPEIRNGSPVWMVTFEARSEAVDLDDEGLRLLAQDIAEVCELRDHLQAQTDALLAS